MSGWDDSAEERGGGDELAAAEYVLGALPAAERAEAAQRIERDRSFAALVDRWEGHFSPFAAAYPESEAPAGVKAAIDRRLFASTALAPERATRGGLWGSLVFWRGLSAAALAALAAYAAVPLVAPPAAPGPSMVAVLGKEDESVHYVALFDKAHNQVALSHLSGGHEAGRDFELWMIQGNNAPVSMGVIPEGSTIRIELSPAVRAKLEKGAVLAISVEPPGGSPTGQPTGPVVATGGLRDI